MGNVVGRRHYVWSLRDQVPVPEGGWSVMRHPPECRDDEDSHLVCRLTACQVADVCRVFTFDGDEVSFSQGIADAAAVIGRLAGGPERPLSLDPLGVRRAVAVVGSAWREDEDVSAHYLRCMALLRDGVNALRQATQARTPGVSIERMWPLYFILNEDPEGHFEVIHMVVVEHGFHPVPVATAEQPAQAERILLATWSGSPIETYLHFELDARRAVDTEGDYTEGVLKAAAAAEVLLKHTAWMLTWEATTVLAQDPAPSAVVSPSADAKPRSLIGSVLMPRLRGSWESGSADKPVGGWRTHVAQRRNAVIHLGYRPVESEAHEAIAALDRLRSHVLDRLAAMANVYPRTALLIAGRDGLTRRDAFAKARATYGAVDLQAELRTYLAWLDAHLTGLE